MDELLSAKKAIRAQALMERSALGESERAQKSAAICSAIEAIPEYAAAPSILFYMPFRAEVDISPLIQKALQQGRRCALPKCHHGCMLRLYSIADISKDVAPGKWGIREPVTVDGCECTVQEFSVIMVPGAAFDRQGHRIGYGAGYYDRLLEASGGNTLKIAPAFALQIRSSLPQGKYDMPVDIIVTEGENIDCRKAGGEEHG